MDARGIRKRAERRKGKLLAGKICGHACRRTMSGTLVASQKRGKEALTTSLNIKTERDRYHGSSWYATRLLTQKLPGGQIKNWLLAMKEKKKGEVLELHQNT